MADKLNIVALAPPGLEPVLREEMIACGFSYPKVEPGGVSFSGGWPDVWRANLILRGASRILVRIASFHAATMSELEGHARAVSWADIFPLGTPLKIDVTCRKSRLYHTGAVAERVEKSALRGLQGAKVTQEPHQVIVRMDHDQCTISVDTSGELLHRRGFKQSVTRAPLRETLAGLYLRAMGYSGDEPLVDLMCGSGTLPMEAAEIAQGLRPGRERTFAFEGLASFDAELYATRRERALIAKNVHTPIIEGSDKDPDAIKASVENAERAGLDQMISFKAREIADAAPPVVEKPGLVMLNPPYGARLGSPKQLVPLYRQIGEVLRTRFSGWRVGLITSEPDLAAATRLPFGAPGVPVPHGPIRVRLYQTGALR